MNRDKVGTGPNVVAIEGVKDWMRNELGNIAAISPNILHHSGGKKNVPGFCGQKDCFDVGIHAVIHAGDLQFELEVGNSSQSPDDEARKVLACKLNRQPFQLAHPNRFEV